MATKKEKLQEEAQRLAMRGQIDKAVTAYRQLITLEPNAINNRQRLGEILVKGGKLDEARVEFESIGKYYASNGFYLKAIAVYKQVQKLFPNDISLPLIMAGLNQKHGLTANALAEYKQVFDYYEKNSQHAEALKILETMQTVDSQNVNVRIKLAESYYNAGRTDDAYQLFGKIAHLLQERNDAAGFAKLNNRIQQLFPQKSTFMLEVLEEQIAKGQANNAVAGLQAMLRVNPNDHRVWDLVVAAYSSMNQPQKLKNAYLHYLKFFPSSSAAQIGLTKCLIAENDFKGAIDQLQKHERELFSAGAALQVLECYHLLEVIDPINLSVLEGMERACKVCGNSGEAAALASKISMLNNITNGGDNADFQTEIDITTFESSEPLSFSLEDTLFAPIDTEVSFYDLAAPEEPAPVQQIEPNKVETKPEPKSVFDTDPFEEEIEIELELDDFDSAEIDTQKTDIAENWLESVDDMFDTLASSPRGVRFDNSPETVDSQSHYDLGIAFKEMGLFDEAIQEFHHAVSDPAIKLRCLILQGACLREKGELEKSETLLRTLMKPELPLDDICSVKYELALTCSAAWKQDESSALLKEIESSNPGFRDVKSLLDSTPFDESLLDFSDEELLGFDLK